jgi:hypothetical protein
MPESESILAGAYLQLAFSLGRFPAYTLLMASFISPMFGRLLSIVFVLFRAKVFKKRMRCHVCIMFQNNINISSKSIPSELTTLTASGKLFGLS